jgi:hydrogenase maturation factor HypE
MQKEFLEEVEGLVMSKALSTLHNISKISAQGIRSNTLELSSLEKSERLDTIHEKSMPRKSSVNRVQK